MKKLLALFLSVIMAVSLAVPAFAEEPEEPGLEGAVPISADVNWEEITGDFAIDWDMPVKQYLAERPGLEEELRANAYSYFAQAYAYYESSQEYMEYWELTEEEFLEEMVLEQAWDLYWKEEERRQTDAMKEALGGVPGQVGVMVNGQYIQFPDAAPEVANGRTMTPVRTLVESLGGEVEYADGVVVCKAGSVRLTFTLGRDEVLVEYPAGEALGDGQMFPLDCAPYLKDGRTYVPVRFIGEALGYEVGWDSQYETAILLDREALAARFDEKFTILNRVQANSTLTMKEGESCRTDMKGSVAFTAFDSLHGNQTYKAELTGKTLMNTEAANGTCSVIVSDNVVDALMEQIIGTGWAYMDEEDVEQVRALLDGLKDIEFIMNRDGLMWVHAPILDELAGEDNVWFGLDMGAELAQAAFTDTGAATVGTVLASMMDTDSVTDYSTVAGPAAQTLFDLYGDEKFTTSGGVSTLTIGLEELEALYPYDSSLDEFNEFEITMKVDRDGGIVLTMCMETAAQYGAPAMRVTMDCTQNSRGAELSMKYHVVNMGEAEVTLTTTQQITSETPETEPPEGATIVDAAEPLIP